MDEKRWRGKGSLSQSIFPRPFKFRTWKRFGVHYWPSFVGASEAERSSSSTPKASEVSTLKNLAEFLDCRKVYEIWIKDFSWHSCEEERSIFNIGRNFRLSWKAQCVSFCISTLLLKLKEMEKLNSVGQRQNIIDKQKAAGKRWEDGTGCELATNSDTNVNLPKLTLPILCSTVVVNYNVK